MRRETLGGRLDRTINYERATKHHIQINMLDGKGRRHGQHNTGFDTKTKRKKVYCNNKLWGQIKMQ